MLFSDWGKWLLGAIASRQSLDLSAPPPGARNVEVVKVTRFVLQAPLVMPTVTVTQTETVGVIATPIIHNIATRQAQPRPRLDPYHYHSSSHGFEASPSSPLARQLSWVQWLLEERFSPLHLLLALLCTPIPFLVGVYMYQVMIRCAHQLIAYHDDQQETRRIDRLTIEGGYFIGKCLFPETFGYGPPEEPLSLHRTWEAIWRELFYPLLLGVGTGLLRMCVAMQYRLGSGLVRSGPVILEHLGWCTDRLPDRLEAWFKANTSIRITVIRGITGSAFSFFDWLVLSVWHATREERLKRGYRAYLDRSIFDYNLDRQRAYYTAKTDTLDEAALRIMDYDNLVGRFEELQSNFESATQDAIVNLANKTISYRNSIIELVKIVNWTRCTVAQTMNYRHNEKCGRNPNGGRAQFPYTTSQLKFVPVAKNGLHFDIMEYTSARNDLRGADIRNRFPSNTYLWSHCRDGAVYMAYLMENKLNGFYDLFKENGDAIRRNFPGIHLPPFHPHEDPINIANRRLKPVLKSELRWKEQIEDFAVEGRLLQYGQEQPKRCVTFGPDEVRLITPRPQRQAPDPCPRG